MRHNDSMGLLSLILLFGFFGWFIYFGLPSFFEGISQQTEQPPVIGEVLIESTRGTLVFGAGSNRYFYVGDQRVLALNNTQEHKALWLKVLRAARDQKTCTAQVVLQEATQDLILQSLTCSE